MGAENENLDYCQHCGVGPSAFMLGCCDECSERITDEIQAEDALTEAAAPVEPYADTWAPDSFYEGW